MKFSLDYDGTYTEDPEFWDAFIELAKRFDHEVVCLTMRRPDEAISLSVPVVYTSREAKALFAKREGHAIDVWIDDAPQWLLYDG